MKKISLWNLLIVLLALTTACDSVQEEAAAKVLVEKCKTVQIGMPYSKIVAIMGEPLNKVMIIENGREKERIYFSSPSLASTFTQCLIDKETDKVEEIICGEGYVLRE